MNYIESNKALFELFWPAFKTVCTEMLGYSPVVYWPDKAENTTAPTDQFWFRVSRKTLDERLRGFGEGVNQSTKRYDVEAVLYVQLFYPQADALSNTRFPELAQQLKDMLEGKHDPSNVLWTRACKIDELSSERSWFRKNVVCEFTYQEIKR